MHKATRFFTLRLSALWMLLHTGYPPAKAQEKTSLQYPSYNETDVKHVKALIHKGASFRWTNMDSALHYYREAETVCRETGLHSGLGQVLAHIGLACTESGKGEDAFRYYREAMPYCMQPGPFPKALPVLYLHMGVSLGYKGDYRNSGAFYHKALALLRPNRAGDQSLIASIHNNLSSIQHILGDFRQALVHAEFAEKLAMVRKNYPLLASALINKGCAYKRMEITDSALTCFRSSLSLAKSRELNSMAQTSLTNIGIILMAAGDFQGALRHFMEALDMPNTSNPYYGTVIPGYYAGSALFRLGRFNEAEKLLHESLEKAEQAGIVDKVDRGYATLASLYETLGMDKKALQHYRRYQHLKDSLTNIDKIRAIGDLEFRYQTATKDRALAEKELKIAIQERRIAKNRTITLSISGLIVLAGFIFIGTARYRRRIKERDIEVMRLKAVMSGEEKERSRLSRELHDGIGGMLTGIKMNLKSIQKQTDRPSLPEDLDQIMHMLHQMGTEIHKTAHNLMPDILLRHSLAEALQRYCTQLEGKGQLRITLLFQGDLEQLDKNVELSLYRIIQELVQNTVKYAHAESAAVQIRRDGDILHASVEDNGIGFERNSAQGLGLQNIETRVHAMDGYFSIESAPGMGTTAYIELDLRKASRGLS